MNTARLIWPAALLTVFGTLAAPGWSAAPAHDHTRRVLIWSGKVDDTAVISVSGDSVRAATISGKPSTDVETWLSNPLPQRPVRVSLRHPQGRGDIYIVQQPSPDNDFTAEVRVHDPQPGRGYYEFTLDRTGGAGKGPGRQFYQGRREARYYRRGSERRTYYSPYFPSVGDDWNDGGDDGGLSFGFGDGGGFGDDDD